MASFQDTVNALLPTFFFRFNELSGLEASDASANAFIGSYFPTAILGQPSPVETDPSSFAVRGPAAKLLIADAPAADVRNNFTWIVFGYLTEDTANDNNVLFCRNGQIGLGGSNFIAFNDGNIRCELSINSVDYTLSYSISNLVRGRWYFIRVTRNSTSVTMHVNEQLVDTETVTTHPIDADSWSSDGWYFGRSQSANVWHSPGTDEAILFNYALSDPQGLSIYESALNQSFMNGYSNVIPSAILYSDMEPDPISFPFRHNWIDSLIERITFSTGISTATKGYESGNGQRIKPRREIEITQVLKDDVERRMFRAKLNAQQGRKWLWPMLGDRDRLTATIASGVSVFAVDTLYKDYEIGSYFGLRQLNDAGRILHSEELLITALTDTQVTTATPTVNAYTSPEVYPVWRAVISASVSPRGHTDSVEDVTILARLIAEDEKSIPHRIIEWTPTITYKGYEVHDPIEWQSNNWSELRDYEVNRSREDIDYEVGPFTTETESIGASEAFSYRMLLEGKQNHAALLGWFYARAGSLNYLWVPTTQRDFEIVSALSANLTVQGHNYFENFAGSEYRRDLAFIYHDNTMQLRRIQSVALSGVNEVLGLDASVPTLTNLRSVSYLLFCRLADDTLERAMVTDTKARFAWMFQQILSSPA